MLAVRLTSFRASACRATSSLCRVSRFGNTAASRSTPISSYGLPQISFPNSSVATGLKWAAYSPMAAARCDTPPHRERSLSRSYKTAKTHGESADHPLRHLGKRRQHRMHMMPLLIAALLLQHYPAALVTIEVQEDRDVRAHSITISPQRAGPLRTRDERDNTVWTAVRTWEGGYQSVTSDECPAVGRVAASIDALPPVPVAPPSRAIAGTTLPVPPTIKDGYATTLSFRTLNADGSASDITIRGGVPYTQWANTAVGALVGCWEPLVP